MTLRKRVRPILSALTTKSAAPLWNLILKIMLTKTNVPINSARKIFPKTPVPSHISLVYFLSTGFKLGHKYAIPGKMMFFLSASS